MFYITLINMLSCTYIRKFKYYRYSSYENLHHRKLPASREANLL